MVELRAVRQSGLGRSAPGITGRGRYRKRCRLRCLCARTRPDDCSRGYAPQPSVHDLAASIATVLGQYRAVGCSASDGPVDRVRLAAMPEHFSRIGRGSRRLPFAASGEHRSTAHFASRPLDPASIRRRSRTVQLACRLVGPPVTAGSRNAPGSPPAGCARGWICQRSSMDDVPRDRRYGGTVPERVGAMDAGPPEPATGLARRDRAPRRCEVDHWPALEQRYEFQPPASTTTWVGRHLLVRTDWGIVELHASAPTPRADRVEKESSGSCSECILPLHFIPPNRSTTPLAWRLPCWAPGAVRQA